MGLLTRDEILAAKDFQFEDVEVPEWGGTVRVRALTGSERDHYESSRVKGRGKKAYVDQTNMRAALVALALIDEKGKRIFNKADVVALGKKSAAALDRCFDVAARLAGIRAADEEEAEENFPDDPTADSTSD